MNPGIWWGGQGTLQKSCARDTGALVRAEGQDLESLVGQSKTGMRKKLGKEVTLINKLIRACWVPSTQPGAWEYRK